MNPLMILIKIIRGFISTKHVLLVDDISSSGSTFESAAKVIKEHCKQVKLISAMTLFSPIKPIIIKN